MPPIIFDWKGIAGTRRERIEAAAEADGRHVKESYEKESYERCVAADPFWGGVRLPITGPQGFERTVEFAAKSG